MATAQPAARRTKQQPSPPLPDVTLNIARRDDGKVVVEIAVALTDPQAVTIMQSVAALFTAPPEEPKSRRR